MKKIYLSSLLIAFLTGCSGGGSSGVIKEIIETKNSVEYNGTAILEQNSEREIVLTMKDANGKTISNSDILELFITPNDTDMVKILNSNKQEVNLVKNSSSFYIQTNDITGDLELNISAKIKGNLFDDVVNQTLKFIIPHNEIATLSLDEQTTTFNSETRLFEQKIRIYARDSKNQLIKDTTKSINFGLISDVKSNSSGEKLYYTTEKAGGFFGDNGLFTIQNYIANLNLLSYSIDKNDTLITLLNDTTQSSKYVGKFNILNVEDTISLKVDTNVAQNTNALSFAIGTPNRFNECENKLATIIIEPTSGVNNLDGNGSIELMLKYSPYFVGKDIFLYSNVYADFNETNSIGLSTKITLLGTGIENESIALSCEDNVTGICNSAIFIKSSGEVIKNSKIVYLIENNSSQKLITSSDNFKTDCNGMLDFNYTGNPEIKFFLTTELN